MKLVADAATQRGWCEACPDLVMPGELAVTDPQVESAGGGPATMHLDCAVAAGWEVHDVADAADESVLVRAAVRTSARDADDS
jgi:hypothetical protein